MPPLWDEAARRGPPCWRPPSPSSPVVARAVERGGLPADTDPAELLKALVAAIYFRLVFTGEPVDATAADRAVQVALATAHARVLRAL
ncbi:TetR/AcrR family transcriptional regulator C-terminal ligand-binding domain-containing protein [Streptomyces sp. NBC_00161]|uniref:TetR-like C-terminal domain-containing protein n=1 Tax=Streptomyces sp. NBC_00161 TaxID=2975671 RepID=UPI0032563C2C